MQRVDAKVEFRLDDPLSIGTKAIFRYDFRFSLPLQITGAYPLATDREVLDSIRTLCRCAGESTAYSMGSFFCDWIRRDRAELQSKSAKENTEQASKIAFVSPSIPLDAYAHGLAIEIFDQLMRQSPIPLTSLTILDLRNTICSYIFKKPVPLKDYSFDSSRCPDGSIEIPAVTRTFDFSSL